MRQLFPVPADDIDPLIAYGRSWPGGPGAPTVRVNMIASLDGAAAIGGRSGGLGGPADKAVFANLRTLADVILVGGATMRDENYKPVRLADGARDLRRGWGLTEVPPIAVLTRSCRLDWAAPFFIEAEQRPIVITVASADAELRQRAANVAEVIIAGDYDIDLGRATVALGDRGLGNILCEGGPSVAAQLGRAGLLDELCLTLAPLLVAGDGPRILHGDWFDPPARFELGVMLEADGYLFLRYGRAGRTGPLA